MVGQSKVGVALALCFNSQPELKPANQALHSAQMCKMPWEEGEEEPVSSLSLHPDSVILSLHQGNTLHLPVTAAYNPPVC